MKEKEREKEERKTGKEDSASLHTGVVLSSCKESVAGCTRSMHTQREGGGVYIKTMHVSTSSRISRTS